MKFLPIIFANIMRKKIRTLLTVGSFAIALFLFGILATIETAFYEGVEVAEADRLLVLNKTSMTMHLPLSYKTSLQQISGVDSVTYVTWFGGIYQDEKNFFPQFAIDTESYRAVYPEYDIPMEQWQVFLKDRQGAIVGRKTFEQYNWHIGDRIPIQGSIYPGLWEFNICGVYDGKDKSDDFTKFWFHHKLLDDNNPYDSGSVGTYVVKINHPDQAVSISRQIDTLFENSPFETRTLTEKAFAIGSVKQIGNIKLILLFVGGVVFFTLLLVTGSNMAISVRERVNEIAIMKTIGFSDIKILVIVLAETASYAFSGAIVGLGLCKLFTLTGDPTGGLLPLFYLPTAKIAVGTLIAAVVAIVSGLIPAFAITKLQIVDAMRRL
jgi:putative ABC transport system permease protein